MKRLIAILFILMMAMPAMALSPSEQTLLNNIFVSELDYREILDRWHLLYNMASRTPEEDYIMQDYAKKLAHDQDYMAIQIAKLRIAGVNFGSQTVLNVRLAVLEELRVKEQAEVDNITAMRAAISADPSIPPDEKVILLDELASRIPVHENRKNILNGLKAGVITWSID